MSTTMVYNTSSQLESQTTSMLPQKTNGLSIERRSHRPKSLQLAPFDASELSRRLSVVVGTEDEKVDPSIQTPPQSANGIKNYSYHLGNGRQPSVKRKDSTTPRSILKGTSPKESGSPRKSSLPKEPSPKDTGFSPKLHLPGRKGSAESEKGESRSNSRRGSRKDSTSSRRSSILDRLHWRGSNYDEKEEEQTQKATTPAYRHVPKVAASQFARTTTVETVSQKAAHNKQMKPAPGPGAMSNGTMSHQDYNKAYRRAQSLCSGRPYERNSQFQLTILETTAEVDEEQLQQNPRTGSDGNIWNKSFELGGEELRRMSTGNMHLRPDANRNPLDVKGALAQLRRDSLGMTPSRKDSVNSSSPFRKDSGASSAIATPGRRDSNTPASPFRAEFDPLAYLRRDSDAFSSRRGSVASKQEQVDWSQSDEPLKSSSTPSSSRRSSDGKWRLRGRLGSSSRHSEEKDEPLVQVGHPTPPMTPRSPKSGFLARFKRQL